MEMRLSSPRRAHCAYPPTPGAMNAASPPARATRIFRPSALAGSGSVASPRASVAAPTGSPASAGTVTSRTSAPAIGAPSSIDVAHASSSWPSEKADRPMRVDCTQLYTACSRSHCSVPSTASTATITFPTPPVSAGARSMRTSRRCPAGASTGITRSTTTWPGSTRFPVDGSRRPSLKRTHSSGWARSSRSRSRRWPSTERETARSASGSSTTISAGPCSEAYGAPTSKGMGRVAPSVCPKTSRMAGSSRTV